MIGLGSSSVSLGVIPKAIALPNLWYLGRAYPPYATAGAPFGVDGQCDEFYNGSIWQLTAQNEAATAFLATGCYDSSTGLAYLFGNTDYTGDSETYDPVANSFSALGKLPTSYAGASNICGNEGFAVSLSGIAYIFGGGLGPVAGQGSGLASSDVITYSSGVGYTVLPDGSTTTYSGYGLDCFGAYDPTGGLIYVGGGNNNIGPTISIGNTWTSYNTGSGHFANLTNLPAALYGAACFCLNGYICVVGGSQDTTGNIAAVSPATVYRYAISGNSWTTMSNFPVPTADGRACVASGVAYVACGWNASGFSTTLPNANASIYKYNVGGDSWSLASTMEYGAPGSVLFSR
jgi:hypothetical protein